MKKITLKELPEVLTDEIVDMLRIMADAQTEEWIEIYNGWTREQKEQYYEAKKDKIGLFVTLYG